MKAFAERECSRLFVLQQTKCASKSLILKQCHIHNVPGNDFNALCF